MKKNIFFRIILFFSLLLISDYLIGHLLSYYYFKINFGKFYRTTYSLEETKADILIFGSSTASHHYNPKIFEKRLHLSCYNVARDGNYLLYHYAMLKGILKRYSPKIIILDFMLTDLSNASYKDGKFPKLESLSSLLPYYKSHPEIRSIVEMRSVFENVKLYSYIYPYNSCFLNILFRNVAIGNKTKDDYSGYIPLYKSFIDTIIEIDPIEKIDTTHIEIFESFIRDCIKAKVKVFIVCSPRKAAHKTQSYVIGSRIVQQNNIPYIDFSQDIEFLNHPDYFYDFGHLNDHGATVFTEKVIDSLVVKNKRYY